MLPRRNVLIFHNAALGDFLMTWPLAISLGRVLAQSRIIYVTASHKGMLAERVLGVEYSDVENGWHALHGNITSLPALPEKLLKSMQMGVVFSQQKDDIFFSSIANCAGDVPLIHLAPNPPADIHVWQHQLDQLTSFPIIRQGVEQVQKLIREQGLGRKQSGASGRVIIHPGSGAERKNWPIERFIELVSLLRSRGKEVVVAMGEVERERFDSSIIKKIQTVTEVRQCDSTLELYDLLTSAAAYVGNDSGPTHLAAMLGLRVVAIFGPTSDPLAWSPVGPRVSILPFETPFTEILSALS